MCGLLVVLVLAALIAAQTPRVQTVLAEKAKVLLSEKFGGNISFSSLYVVPVKTVVIKDLTITDPDPYIEDKYNRGWGRIDTLLYARSLTASFTLKGLLSEGGIHLRRVRIDDAKLNVATEPDRSHSDNFSRLLGLGKAPDVPTPNNAKVFIRKIEVNNIHVRAVTFKADKHPFNGYGMDWDGIDVVASIKAHNFSDWRGVMSFTVDEGRATTPCGLHLDHISGRARAGLGKTHIENAHLQNETSDIHIQKLDMTYPNSDAFNHHFEEKVLLDGKVGHSIVDMKTISYLANDLDYCDAVFDLRSGKVDGYINDLNISCVDATELGSGVMVKGGASIIGLSTLESPVYKFNVDDSNLSTEGLSKVINSFSRDGKLDLSKIAKGQRFTFKGKAEGPLNRILAKGSIISGFGSADADLDIRNAVDTTRAIEISGTVQTKDFDAGKVMGIKELGPVTARTGLRAKLDEGNPSVIVDSLFVDRLNALKYDYTGIAAVGKISGKSFDGRVICNDPNLNFLFQGIFNLSSKTNNALYKFFANLGYADLKALNIDTRGGKSKVSGQVSANFMQVTRGDIIGDIDISDVNLESDFGKSDVGSIHIASHSNSDIHRIQFQSGFADAGFIGRNSIAEIISDIQKITTRRELPALYQDKGKKWTGGSYDLDCQLHDTRDILSFIKPGLYIADSTAIALNINQAGVLTGNVTSPRIALGDKYVKNLDMQLDNQGESLNCMLTGQEIKVGAVGLSNSALTAYAADNGFNLSFHYDGKENSNYGELYLSGVLERDASDTLVVRMEPLDSYMVVADETWNIGKSEIIARAGDYTIKDFRLSCGDQSVRIDGGLSPDSRDSLMVNLSGVDLDIINGFVENIGIAGIMSGHAILRSPMKGATNLWSNISLDNLSFGGADAGNIRMATAWDEDDEKMSIFLKNMLKGREALSASGYIRPQTKEVDLTARLSDFDLSPAAPFVQSIFSELGGRVGGELKVSGSLDEPDFSSDGLRFKDTKFTVAFTNVPYTINGPFHVDAYGLYMDQISVWDRFDGTGTLVGKVGFDHLRDPYLDAKLDVTRMEVMHNTPKQSESIYGDLFATGEVRVSGPLSNIVVDVDATTVKDGNFHIPIAGSASASASDLLTFKEKEKYEDPYDAMRRMMAETTKARRAGNLTARARINATPDVLAMLELDAESGNAFSGRGNGTVTVDIGPSRGSLSLGGDYNIVSGNFHFSALSIVSKDFEIQNGSSVKFGGDISDTEFDVDAKYSIKTTLAALISDTTSVSSRRTVNCGIKITDKLRNPQLAFSIDIPDLDPTTKSLVESALNTSDKIQKQFVALLITGGFIPNEQSGVVYNTSNMLYSNISDIMSGQLNNILQKLNIPLDLGLSYQQNEGGTDIFDVAVSTQLFNNRVILNGNIANRQYSTSSSNDVVGDLDIDVKIDKSGQFRFNLFSHSADAYTSYLDNSQRNGIGVTYQKEFTRFREFFRSLFMSRKKKEQMTLDNLLQQKEQVVIKIEADE